jgi:hypothetical protein
MQKLQLNNYFKNFVFSCNFYNVIDIVIFLLKQKIMMRYVPSV